MDSISIQLGGAPVEIRPLPFGKLKRLFPAINRVAANLSVGQFDEATMDELGGILAAATGLEPAALDALPIKISELSAAFAAVVEATGLVPKGAPRGEAPAVASPGTGMTSMPTSPPSSAGPGETSTS
jgi:hypothetical protein